MRILHDEKNGENTFQVFLTESGKILVHVNQVFYGSEYKTSNIDDSIAHHIYHFTDIAKALNRGKLLFQEAIDVTAIKAYIEEKPDRYRILDDDEIIRKDDEFETDDGRWKRIINPGLTAGEVEMNYRRKI